jgi:hypothetical protein
MVSFGSRVDAIRSVSNRDINLWLDLLQVKDREPWLYVSD